MAISVLKAVGQIKADVAAHLDGAQVERTRPPPRPAAV